METKKSNSKKAMMNKTAELARAAENGDIETVKRLLAEGVDPDLCKKKTDGPVHYAAMFGQFDALKLLIESGASINVKGAYGRTPLIYAAASAASPVIVKYLLEHGADIKAVNDNGENALFELITNDQASAEVAAILIDAGLSVKAKHKSDGAPLHWAAFCGRLNIIEILIQKGADVNQKDNDGETPVIKAMSNGGPDAVKFLFEHGADPESASSFGTTLLEYVSEKGDTELAKKILEAIALKKQKKGNTVKEQSGALAKAAKKGDSAMVQLLLDSGISVDERDSWGAETPLMKAAYNGRIKVLNMLLDAGADIRARDYRGNTALHHGAWAGHAEIVKILLEHGADISEKNNLDWNALMQACVEGHDETAELLVVSGSPLNDIEKERGATPLTLAIFSGNTKLAEFLKSRGAHERFIKMRKNGEPYFSITECGICEYLPHKKDLGSSDSPEDVKMLELVSVESDSSDRYTTSSDMVRRCPNCGTYYHHYHYIDTEDAFISGPHITQYLQRYNLLRLKSVLNSISKKDELSELESRYESLISEMIDLFKRDPLSVIPNIRPYFIESITDYFVQKNNWGEIENLLLKNSDPGIVLDTVYDLIVVSGEVCRSGVYPSYANYRDFTAEIQEKVRAMIRDHSERLRECINRYKNDTDESLKKRAERLLESAKYYKIL